ncbi:uncharacterized protein At2g33490 [Mercurialis annua]|uniref:uncharacterized protein At2g33490 n=1 Tax=Mercurialis annua TaxID=3986 RepID=UPI00215F32B7|nr:uncharacterized protein At2g33490 [Mercurialis annua]
MKTSLKKLREFALRHGEHNSNDGREFSHPSTPVDELAQASLDMENMGDCYDSFLSGAAATANGAFEFSEALHEMGASLLKRTSLNDDEECDKVLLMLGKVHFELQKHLDKYRSHIFKTITVPSESLLNELRNVEEMKRQCDEKRNVYEYMKMRQQERGRGRSGKAETFSMQQLREAYDEYDEESTLFVFRLKSLKQGQSRSLFTQAARHYAAQVRFFKKGLKSLEALEPYVKSVAEQQHIDYLFDGLEDDDGDDDDNDDNEEDDDTYDEHDDGELSFEYGQNDLEQDVSTSRNPMELDMVDVTYPQVATSDALKENRDRNYRKSFSFRGDVRIGSQSAPIFADIKSNPSEAIKQLRPSFSKRFNAYVLPTPVDTKILNSTGSSKLVPQALKTNLNGQTQNLWHSSPLEPKQREKLVGDEKFSRFMVQDAESVLRESNKYSSSTQLPPPQTEGHFISRIDPPAASDFKKVKRYAFSGPITSKAWSTKPILAEPAGSISGPLSEKPTVQLPSSSPKVSPKVSPVVSPKLSPTASPTFVSSPRISELHELPRPPSSATSKSSKYTSFVGHSAPLVSRGHMRPTMGRSSVWNGASPLPVPSQAVTRSFSIPSSRAMNLSKPLESVRSLEMIEDINSPPLTPILLSNAQPSTTGSPNVNQTIHIRGAD